MRSRAESIGGYQPQYRRRVVLRTGEDGTEHLEAFTELIPKLTSSQVLVRVHASPIHVHDEILVTGGLGPLGDYPGLEGCGRVVDRGGVSGWTLMGKNVSFVSRVESAWADLVIVNASDCIVLADQIPLELRSVSNLIPLAAQSMVHIAQQRSSSSILVTCATTSLGTLTMQTSNADGLIPIGVVRSSEGLMKLDRLGFDYIYCESDPDFWLKLEAICVRLECRIAFDGKGGAFSSKLLEIMPHGSTVFVYGSLEGDLELNLTVDKLIDQEKSLRGMNTFTYLDECSTLASKSIRRKAATIVELGLTPTVSPQRILLDEINDGLIRYFERATPHKWLLVPDPTYEIGTFGETSAAVLPEEETHEQVVDEIFPPGEGEVSGEYLEEDSMGATRIEEDLLELSNQFDLSEDDALPAEGYQNFGEQPEADLLAEIAGGIGEETEEIDDEALLEGYQGFTMPTRAEKTPE